MDFEQKEIIKEQDEQLHEIELSIGIIKQNSKLINEKISEQEVYIQEMNNEMDKTEKKMGKAMKKIGEVLHVQNQGQVKIFLSLLFIAVILFFMLILF